MSEFEFWLMTNWQWIALWAFGIWLFCLVCYIIWRLFYAPKEDNEEEKKMAERLRKIKRRLK